MKHKNKRVSAHINLFIASLFFSIIALTQFAGFSAGATGSATFSLYPGSGSYTEGNEFTLTVVENSNGQAVNNEQSYLTYNASQLEYISQSNGSSGFGTCIGASSGGSGSIITQDCGTTPGTQPPTTSQDVAEITFKALGVVTTGISFASGSLILATPGSANVWNGDNTTVYSYSLVAPAPPPQTPAPQKTVTKSTKKTTKTTTTTTPTTTTPTTTTTTTTTPVPKTYIVAIKVVNDQSKPVVRAYVKLGKLSAYSDTTGVASFIKVPAGKQTLSISYGGKTYTQAPVTIQASLASYKVQTFNTKLPLNGSDLLIFVILVVFLVVFAVAEYIIIKRYLSLKPPKAHHLIPSINHHSPVVFTPRDI